MKKYNIVLVDDHILVAKAISGVIADFQQYNVLYEVENGRALIEKFKFPRNIPDIVLLDISMPVMDGFETAKWLNEHHPGVLVLVLSMQDDEYALIRMLRAGARGYLLKNIHPGELEVALNMLVTKGYYYTEWVTNKVHVTFSGEPYTLVVPNTHFTERELEFIKYCCTELTYHEIADKMGCSPRTVDGYRDALFRKLEIKTRVGLVLYAIRHGKYVL